MEGTNCLASRRRTRSKGVRSALGTETPMAPNPKSPQRTFGPCGCRSFLKLRLVRLPARGGSGSLPETAQLATEEQS